ncbi:MAG: hypothetical protein QOC87_783 [Actinomycetota bacterium]|nr:hypothetical protein [Actinomycetota bacterium]
MRRSLTRVATATALSVALVGLLIAPEASGRPGPIRFGKNTYAYTSSYGEPGLAIAHDGTVYVTTPGENGAVLARSENKGNSWTKLPTVTPSSTSPGSQTSGSDSDVAVAKDGTVYVADLEIDGISVWKSTDKGKTFPQETFVDGSADREWLATEGKSTVYLAWHELASGTMLAAVSNDGGKSFSPPHTIYSDPQTAGESAHNGTSIGGISVDGKGAVYALYGVTRVDTTDTTYGTPPISTIRMSVSTDHGATWNDYEVNPGAADANYGNFWMASGVDKAGNVYAVYSGYAHKGEPMHVWLQESTDHGQTWTKPFIVDDKGGNDLFGWVTGGGPGVAVVAWYHTDDKDKNDTKAQWVVKVAQVRGLVAQGKSKPHPDVQTATASDHSNHVGGICTLGIFCGVLPGSSSDRSLLDFFKVAVDPAGRPEVVWSDNNRPGTIKTGVGFARQTSGESAFDPRIYH